MSGRWSLRKHVRVLAGISCLALFGLAAGPSPAQAELLIGLTTTDDLVTFSSNSPGTILSQVDISGLASGESILGIDSRPATGGIYALGSTSRLYLIDLTSGVATQVGSDGAFTLDGDQFGFDFNPTVDRIRVTSDTGQNLRLNPNNGALAATDGSLAFATGDPNEAATPNVVGSAYTNNFVGATTTTLYALDSALDILATQVPPNSGTLNTIGALGFDTSDLVGFDISGASGVAFASLTAPAGNASLLYTIDLATGAATLVGTIGTQAPLVALTAAIPEPGSLSLVGLGAVGLFAFARRRRAGGAEVSSSS